MMSLGDDNALFLRRSAMACSVVMSDVTLCCRLVSVGREECLSHSCRQIRMPVDNRDVLRLYVT